MPDYPLGRRPQPWDPRDANHPMLLANAPGAPLVVTHTSRYWYPGPAKLNQGLIKNINGGYGSCVAYAGGNWEQGSPTRTKGITNQSCVNDYNRCKQLDGMPNVEGTYSRALAKVYEEQGRLERYLWAQNPQQMKDWVLEVGPVLVGTNWTEQMFYPTADGFVTVESDIVGGHEYKLRGFSRPRDAYRCEQSWGEGWGMRGEFWMKCIDIERLVFNEGGDCWAAVERRP